MEIQSRITIEDLAGILNKDFWAVKKAYQRGKYSTATKIDGRVTIDIKDSAIPVDARLKYFASIAQAPLQEEDTSVPVVTQPASADIQTSELNDKERKIALARAALINIYNDTIKSAPRGEVLAAKMKFEHGYNNGALRDILPVVGPRDWKTLDRWLKVYLESNYDYTVLARGYKAPKASVTSDESQILLQYWLTPNRPKISDAIYWAKKEMARRNMPFIKSDITYRRWLENWKSRHYDIYVARREGEKALNDKCLPDISRDANLLNVGDCLIADGHTLDFELINPHTGKPKRMSMIMFYDWRSNMPVGWEIMPTENVKAIAIALRRAIKFLGMVPKVVYLDNGKAFSGKYFNGIDFQQTEIPGLFKRLNIQTVFAWPYHGQSKPVERFFGSFGQLERLMISYVGNSIANKPARLNRGEKIYSKLYNSIVDVSQFTVFTAHKAIAAWVKDYSERPQQDGHLKGITPAEVFMAGRGPGIDDRELLYLMMEEHFTTPRKCKIHIPKLGVYFSEQLFGINHEVKIKYDFIENGFIYIYDKTTGDFICSAEVDKKAHPLAFYMGTEEDQQFLKEKIKQKLSLKNDVLGDLKQHVKDVYLPETQRYLEEANIISLDPVTKEPQRKEKISSQKKSQVKNTIRTAKLYKKIQQQQEEEEEEILRFSFQKKAAVK